MDFASLLHQANKNLKNASKKVNEAQDEVDAGRMRQLDQIRLQKLERLKKEELAKQRREDERRAQFQIPKKKADSTVDPDRIKSFKAKQEEERRKKEKDEARKKEELIKLRLAANGGKANKKIAKHFGADVIDLQVKFGQDKDHIEKLHKYKERDEEEAQRLADHYRNGVAKAFANKKTVEEKVKEGARLKQSGIPKKNLTILSSDGFEKGKNIRSDKSGLGKDRKRAAEEALDFSSLMKKAENISSGKEETNGGAKEREGSSSMSSYRAMKERYMSKDESGSSSSARPSSSFKIPKPMQSHVKTPYVPNGLLKKREDEPLPSGIILPKPQTCIRSKPKGDNTISKDDMSRLGASSSSSSSVPPAPKTLAYPTDDRGKRILPGDIRYKAWLEEQRKIMKEREKNPPPPQPMTSKEKDREKAKNIEKSQKRAISSHPPSHSSHGTSSSSHRQIGAKDNGSRAKMRAPSSYSSTGSHSSKISKYEEEKRKILMREQRMKEAKKRMENERREMERSRERNGGKSYGFTKGYDSDEDDEDEESDLDDFIDDSGDLDDLSRKDFEETLRSINKNYDTKKWKINERLIDERSMHSNWRQVEKEERASARAGLKDDIREALKNKSEAL
ncbi:hypothetical protein PMAYCL1PPCAC_18384 [Pristionchus mayeri]|uniref:Protein SPT2 homolog n=1 Tax=Pristionchus mayeri TaxID=1317129 RepID=A0AAN5CPT0_9BILA|nr:hypothetical protein PMAYCL1PPCAC_18384 [Pristionchus mayeri]